MGVESVMKQLLQDNKGWITLKEVLARGVSKYEFYKSAKKEVERAAYGVYVSDASG